jgi:hypothetical protein
MTQVLYFSGLWDGASVELYMLLIKNLNIPKLQRVIDVLTEDVDEA